jgi:hypothetical protein
VLFTANASSGQVKSDSLAIDFPNYTYRLIDCDSLSPKLVEEFNNYSPKKFRKLMSQKKLDPITAFNVATYMRHKADTIYRQWYVLYIDLIKRSYELDSGKIKDKGPGIGMMFNLGIAYYFLDNFNEAEKWLAKAIKEKDQNPCLNHYYSDTQEHLSK